MKPKDINILVGCEESQSVCIAFREKGFNAFSCDLKDCSGPKPEYHIKEDVLKVIKMNDWHCLIAHPPCTYLSFAATKYWNEPGRVFLRLEALNFFAKLFECGVNSICLENPKGCASPTIAKYDQEIQPYYFGESHIKTTWLWLKNLPKLTYSMENNLFEQKTAAEKPEPIYTDKTGKKRYFTDAITGSNNGGYKRSKTFKSIAKAMADQWGNYLLENVKH